MDSFMIYYSTSQKALEAYEIQSRIVKDNVNTLSDLSNDPIEIRRAGEIQLGNRRRLNAIAEAYTCLRIMELCTPGETHV